MSIYIIAEGGVNHNGELSKALDMIDVAADAGADAVKFQVFKSENLVTSWAPKAEYQFETTDVAESQLDMLRKLELQRDDYDRLIERCRDCDIDFMVSPFDLPGIDFLAYELKLPVLKLPSGEITNGPFLLRAARTGCEIILSTGMSDLEEVRRALGVLAFGYTVNGGELAAPAFAGALESEAGRNALADKVTLLHCTSEYPAPFEDVNLRVLETLSDAFGLRTGYSDHTPGIVAPIAAAARGARVIEKHFTLSQELSGPDHKASLEPQDLTAMVDSIRKVEVSLGDGLKTPRPSELGTRDIARRSLVASCKIAKGDVFSENNVAAKRPDGGLSPMQFWALLGRRAERDYQDDELIALEAMGDGETGK